MGIRGSVLTVHGYQCRKGGILTGHGQRVLGGIVTGPDIGRRGKVLTGDEQKIWCSDWTWT